MEPVTADARQAFLLQCFEQGRWVQHLSDQNNRSAPVQGVRLYYSPTSTSAPTVTGLPPPESDMCMTGEQAYVCVTPRTVRIEGEGVLKVS